MNITKSLCLILTCLIVTPANGMKKVAQLCAQRCVSKNSKRLFTHNSQFPSIHVSENALNLFKDYVISKNLDNNNVGFPSNSRKILENVFYNDTTEHGDKVGFILLNHALGNLDNEYFNHVIDRESGIIPPDNDILTNPWNLDLTKPRKVSYSSKYNDWFHFDLGLLKTFMKGKLNDQIHFLSFENFKDPRYIISTTLHHKKYVIFDIKTQKVVGSVPHHITLFGKNYDPEQPCASFGVEKEYDNNTCPLKQSYLVVLYALQKPDSVAIYGIDKAKVIEQVLEKENDTQKYKRMILF